MNTKSTPTLSKSQLQFRIGLARQRTSAYPMHKLDFIMMDLERPAMSTRHAHWCTGDLTGRVLEFLCCAEGIDGQYDPRLVELFERILRTRRPSGLFGQYAPTPSDSVLPEDCVTSGCHRLFNGFIKYFDLTGDYRALDAAIGLGDWLLKNKDEWVNRFKGFNGCAIEYWVTEPLAGLYRLTGEQKYLDFAAMIADSIKTCEFMHSHGFMSTMRGLQLAAIYTGDKSWNEKPEFYRRKIIDERYEMPDGCISEMFPRNFRNEGCSIADWLMLNLNAGYISGSDEPYAKAETILWNALFFNQFITGGFGHRDLTKHGYAMGPLSEAWWCCTENCGMAMTEYARHAVTLEDDHLNINLLTPGKFVFNDLEVVISTNYPATADTIVSIKNMPANMKVNVRTPGCIKNAAIVEDDFDSEKRLKISGRVGHYLEDYQDKALLKYGPLVLAPLCNYWNSSDTSVHESNVPGGYIPSFMPDGLPRIDASTVDSDGFMKFESQPIPDWSYFEVGPEAELGVTGASAYAPLVFNDGQTKKLWFSPLCHITSDMSYYDTPIMFNK